MATDKLYLAPEVEDDEIYASKKSEIFNLGLVLYHIVCGTRIYNRKNFTEIDLFQGKKVLSYYLRNLLIAML